MSGTVSTIAPTVDATGIHVSDYPTVLAYFEAQYQSIYGADVYLEADSQDGQFLALIALAYTDLSSLAVAVFNAFSPAAAQGTGLSSVVKINGIARLIATYSQVDVIIGGTVGTTITNGSIRDENGLTWALPALVVIPTALSITVTATCATIGAIAASPNTQWTINTPTRGWSSISNTSAGTPGNPVESDPALRVRQTKSTMLASETVVDGIIGSLNALPGVTRVALDENDSSTTNANGTPAGAAAFVVEGGDATQIATVIAEQKTMGTPTYGTTSETLIDSAGLSQVINFFRPAETEIVVTLNLKALVGYTNGIGAMVAAQVAASIAALPIGAVIYVNRLYVAAALPVLTGGATYNVTSIQIARTGSVPAAADIALAFNEAAVCAIGDITVIPS